MKIGELVRDGKVIAEFINGRWKAPSADLARHLNLHFAMGRDVPGKTLLPYGVAYLTAAAKEAGCEYRYVLKRR
jgi:hypothetical protein